MLKIKINKLDKYKQNKNSTPFIYLFAMIML